MRLRDAKAGDVFECPGCGADVEVIAPSAPTDAETVDPPAPSRPTPKPTKKAAAQGQAPEDRAPVIVDGAVLPPAHVAEVTILELRPSMRSALPGWWAGLVLSCIVCVGGSAAVLATRGPLWLAGAALALGLAMGALPWLWTNFLSGSSVRLTNKRLIDTDGVLRRHVSEVLHKDVRNVRVDQTIWQRLNGAGSIAIHAANAGEPEIFMDNVPQPHRVRAIIDAYRPM